MIKEKWKTQLWAAVIAFLTGLGGMGCLITALRIQIPEMSWITVACAVSAVVFSLCFRHKVGWAPLCLLALLGGYFWQKGPLEQSVEGLVFHITALYDTGYGWGAVYWTELDPSLADMTLALCAASILVTAAMAWTVAARRTAWLGVTVGSLPLAACLVLTNTVPDETYLYLLLTALVLVLMTQSIRNADEKKGNTLTAMLAIPVAAAMAILLLLCPQKTYDGQKGAERIEEFVMELLGLEEDEGPVDLGAVGDYSDTTVKLTSIGPKSYQSSKVMSVKSESTELLYLRGCAYDVYDGMNWHASEGEWELDGDYQVTGKAWKVTVSTMKPHDVIYMPYVNASKLKQFQSGRIPNTEERTRFEYYCTAMPEFRQYFFGALSSSIYHPSIYYGAAQMQQYLQLPEQTAQQARQWLEENVDDIPDATTGWTAWLYVEKVMDAVRRSAMYDLGTGKMPEDAEDFALWFLEESDTGYCVHFATAATVLLRSMGIPARYVTGYLVQPKANNADTMVRLRDAHAWVEVHMPNCGWITLDPTPAGFGSPVPPPQTDNTQPSGETTEPTETTEPAVTQQTTEATEPEQTEPSETVAVIGGVDKPQTPEEKDGGSRWLWLLLVFAAVAAAIGQWQLRLWHRRKKQHTGTANQQALARWQEVVLHGRLRGKIPEELHALAQKAKFSQHMLTRQELRQFEVYLIHSRKALRRAPLWLRLYHMLILAIY